ncbi:MAG: DNA cytosine methyltransferase [Chloroflexales bacterium]|nr:DNA cytosine methyltransferase [Chloroflexales bacterium]
MATASICTVLDLFCGAGGLPLGLARAGLTTVLAVDNNITALQTYSANLGGPVAEHDLSKEVSLPKTTVVVGGPPCQGFSSAGLRQSNDHRNSLVGCFARTVAELQPFAFLFENVEGFLTAEGGDRVVELLDPLINAGYRIHLRKINAANYGAPQHRKRVIAIGGLGWNPSFPLPTHSAFGAPGAQRAARGLRQTPSISATLMGLPSPALEAPGFPQGHFSRPLAGIDLQRAMALQPGQTMRDLPAELQHESFRRRAFRRVMDGTPTEQRGGAPAGIKRLKPDEPAKAITSGANAEFLHPFEHRPLTIRECARIQTFPDDFEFRGSSAEQMQLIGNAVPPLLAEVIGQSLVRDLTNAQATHNEGALLSFIPTVSDGVSPALRHVIDRVRRQFIDRLVVEEHTLWD